MLYMVIDGASVWGKYRLIFGFNNFRACGGFEEPAAARRDHREYRGGSGGVGMYSSCTIFLSCV